MISSVMRLVRGTCSFGPAFFLVVAAVFAAWLCSLRGVSVVQVRQRWLSQIAVGPNLDSNLGLSDLEMRLTETCYRIAADLSRNRTHIGTFLIFIASLMEGKKLTKEDKGHILLVVVVHIEARAKTENCVWSPALHGDIYFSHFRAMVRFDSGGCGRRSLLPLLSEKAGQQNEKTTYPTCTTPCFIGVFLSVMTQNNNSFGGSLRATGRINGGVLTQMVML